MDNLFNADMAQTSYSINLERDNITVEELMTR